MSLSAVHRFGHIRARLRECWILASNLRLSGDRPDWTKEPTIPSLVIEWVEVEEAHRREGHFKRFLEAACKVTKFDMVVVEAVQNPILAEALLRWGWDVDPGVMDFYWRRQHHEQEKEAVRDGV